MKNPNITHQRIFQLFKKWLNNSLLISRAPIYSSLKRFALILIGSVVIFPLVKQLPLLGWDWFFFFNANNPAFNIYLVSSPYPPFARHIIELLNWMDWRTSLTWLNSITIMTIALATWINGGKYKEIILALTTPPLWFLMWVGHPDGLVLLGLITGIIPLILMKPILSIFAILSHQKLQAWSILFLIISLIIWPGWIFSLRNATIGHEAAMGWADLGWPLIFIGLILILGAGKDPYRLMAAGCFLTPYLMPYHMAILIPAIGKPRGWRQLTIWISSWFVFVGTGLSGYGHLFSFVFPLAIYFLCEKRANYQENVMHLFLNIKRLLPGREVKPFLDR